MGSADGRNAIFLTGGASGVGRETAKLFVAKGWFVGAVDVNANGLSTLEQEVGRQNCMVRTLDVTDRKAYAQTLKEFTNETDGKLDILFNNAGVGRAASFESQTFDEIIALVNINLVGVLIGVHESLKYLKATPGSMCFTTSSSVASFGFPGVAVYSATKSALKGFTESMAVELKPYGIRVADVLPGMINTPMLPPGVAANAAREGMFRALHPIEVAAVVWDAYLSDKLHWYVPTEIAELAKMATLDAESTRDKLADGSLFGQLSAIRLSGGDQL